MSGRIHSVLSHVMRHLAALFSDLNDEMMTSLRRFSAAVVLSPLSLF
ncbi:MAG: hypothetical protein OXI96_03655 [Acidimicrobiaceae bacterium]|nr:hypothetical protein [Acidimicrobiaceae bacterium]